MNTVLVDFDRSKKITAIKALRAVTGWGLKEAKDVIDSIERVEPQIISIHLNEAQRATLRGAGIIVSDNPSMQITDIVGTMRGLIQVLLDKQEFRAAQSIIDAMEVLSE